MNMTTNTAYLAGLRSELAGHQASMIAEPSNKDWARRIKEVEQEIKMTLAVPVENTAADHDGIETAMHPQSRSRKTTKPAAE